MTIKKIAILSVSLGIIIWAVLIIQYFLTDNIKPENRTLLTQLFLTDSIKPENRGIGFVYMFSASPDTPDWNAGFTHIDGIFKEFDVTREGMHTLTLPPWPRTDTLWIGNCTNVYFLSPTTPDQAALPVNLESIAINKMPKIINKRFTPDGSFWNNEAGTYFGDIALTGGETIADIPGYQIQQFSVPDIIGGVPIDQWSSAGASASLGTINEGDIVTVTFKVGEGKTNERPASQSNPSKAAPNSPSPTHPESVGSTTQNPASPPDIIPVRDPQLSDFPPGTRFIALTFDDGPNTNYTVQMLDELARLGSSASFYVNPVKINSTTLPVIHRMIREGHDVENHSWSHTGFGAEMGTGTHTTAAAAREDIERASQAIYDATGHWPFSFRAPFFEWGGAGNILHGLDRELNMVFVDSGMDTNDWLDGKSPQDIANFILNHDNPNGGIVLMHDCGGNRQRTVDSLALFIPHMQERGYVFVTVRQLMMLTGSMPELFQGTHSWPRVNQWVPVRRSEWEPPDPLWPNNPNWWETTRRTGDVSPLNAEIIEDFPENNSGGILSGIMDFIGVTPNDDGFTPGANGDGYAESFVLPLTSQRVNNVGELVTAGGLEQTYRTSDTAHRWYFANPFWIPGVAAPEGPGNEDLNYTPRLSQSVLNRARYLVLEFAANVNGTVSIGLGYGLEADPWWVGPTFSSVQIGATRTVVIELSQLGNIDVAGETGFSIEINRPAGSEIRKAYLSNGAAGGTPRYFIAITADDGPHATFTQGMLDHLQTLNNRPEVVCGKNGVDACASGVGCGTVCGTVSRAHISFFVMGQEIAGRENLLGRMLQEGHSIENHSWSHPNFVGATAATIRDQISKTNNEIKRATAGVTDFYGVTHTNGAAPFSFRSPQFSIDAGAMGIDVEFNMPWIFSGLDVDDWRGHSGSVMADFIVNGRVSSCPVCGTWGWCSIRDVQYFGAEDGGADGGIILIHDGGGDRTESVKFVLDVIPRMQAQGYHFVTIEQLFAYMDAEPMWIPATVQPGSGDGSRVNDWVRQGWGRFAR